MHTCTRLLFALLRSLPDVQAARGGGSALLVGVDAPVPRLEAVAARALLGLHIVSTTGVGPARPHARFLLQRHTGTSLAHEVPKAQAALEIS